MFIPRFDIINGLGVDYLHNTLLGVIKMLVKLWFNKKYKSEQWYIGDKVKQVDRAIKSLKLPNLISRVPRNIEDDLKQWKASEYRTFMLCYSAPILVNFLPTEYFKHYCFLVKALYLLLQDSISESDLLCSSLLLKQFCMQIERLYGERYNSYNSHNLLHMTKSVRQLGPLWAQSSFWYEDYNGDFKHLFYGTQSVDMQIVTNTIMQHRIPEIARTLQPGSIGYKLYMKMTVRFHQLTKATGDFVASGIKTIGILSKLDPDFPEKSIISHIYPAISDMMRFKRLYFHGCIVQSKAYKRVTKRNTYTIYYHGRFGYSYGFIKYFLKVSLEAKTEYLAIIEIVTVRKDTMLNGIEHIIPIKSSNNIDVCKVADILEVCSSLSLASGDYIAHFPNKLEND
uniref:Uncharacterized protein n=1 Tax=Clytia hemisphaerica TaxID=252671 RepID=A0A7M5V8Y5_9CNID|eukprot:TCONS_00033698-protein